MANIYTVSQVNSYIKNMFATDIVLERLQISGEVSNCKYNPSGHIYFTLKDAGGTLSAVMFAREAYGLRFRLKDGMKVVVYGRVSIYEAAGKYQVYVSAMEQLGSGDLHEKYLALKNELEEMGMFDARYKQKIPTYAKRVGIVTAKTGAAIQDIINISSRRNPYVQLILYPAQVQGDGAAETIVAGIEYLDRYGNVDVIIVGRGGGSIEDLWAFNERIVAEAIFHCNTPIISAVGHETDFTIADFVADLRVPTPSAAAEMAVYDFSILQGQLEEGIRRMNVAMRDRVNLERMNLNHMTKTLMAHSPERMLADKRVRLDDLLDRMIHGMQTRMDSSRRELALRTARLDDLSPLKKLSSGYSYTTVMDKDNKLHKVTCLGDVNTGDCITVNVSDGQIKATVTDKREVMRQSIHSDR